MKSYQRTLLTNTCRILFIFLAPSIFSSHVEAQNTASTELSKINLYADFGGGFSRGLASLNFERRIFSSKKLTLYARGGIGGGGIDETAGPGIIGAFTMLTGKGNNHVEINGGTFIGRNSDFIDELFFMPIADLGYRYEKPEGGFIFKTSAGFLGIRFGLGYAF